MEKNQVVVISDNTSAVSTLLCQNSSKLYWKETRQEEKLRFLRPVLTRERSGVKTANQPQSTARGEPTPAGRRPGDGQGPDADMKEREGLMSNNKKQRER